MREVFFLDSVEVAMTDVDKAVLIKGIIRDVMGA